MLWGQMVQLFLFSIKKERGVIPITDKNMTGNNSYGR